MVIHAGWKPQSNICRGAQTTCLSLHCYYHIITVLQLLLFGFCRKVSLSNTSAPEEELLHQPHLHQLLSKIKSVTLIMAQKQLVGTSR